jgi:hypothetical protein
VATGVYLEIGRRRTFAAARDWPGWCRAGKGEEAALEALAAALPRYAVVAAEAAVRLPPRAAAAFEVRERLAGDASTDFGAPGAVAVGDADPLTAREATRQADLVAASWTVLDRVAAAAPAGLRKGPRGGGRDRDAVVAHVIGAEAAYARKLGIRQRVPEAEDADAVAALRSAVVDALRAARDGAPPVPKGWPPRYAARRVAWHALDHAWEIEDRATS